MVVGTAAVAGGWRWGGLLILFFVSSSALSRWRRAAKAARTAGVVEKGDRRDAAQVLANGGVFAALVAVGSAMGSAVTAAGRATATTLLAGAAAGALAAAAADSWATEVGTAVGGVPRALRGWRPVPPGTSGAVTVAGSLALAAGAACTAGAAALLGMPTAAAVGALAGGVAGAWADTLAGAAAQERRWCDRCALATEQRVHACGTPTRVRGGLAGLGNDGVNGLCTAAGAAAGALAARAVA